MSLARAVGRVLPNVPVARTAVEQACRDPAAVDRMKDDPLRYRGNVSAGWAGAMFNALEVAHSKVDSVELPLFIQHGSADKMCDPNASRDFFERVPSKDKSIKIYNGAYHSLLKEPEGVGEQALKDIVDWCSSRLPARETPQPPRLPSEHASDEATLPAVTSTA